MANDVINVVFDVKINQLTVNTVPGDIPVLGSTL